MSAFSGSPSESESVRPKRRCTQREAEDELMLDASREIAGELASSANTSSLSGYCIACQKPLAENPGPCHPWLYGLVCTECDGTCQQVIQRWTPGKLFQLMCENEGKNCTAAKNLVISRNSRLTCLSCLEPEDQQLTVIRHDWKENIWRPFFNSDKMIRNKKPLRVLSLFDGIGTGLLVLDELGLEVEEYFSCEVDDAALDVTNFRFHGRMTELGSVTNLSNNALKELGRIDLLIGGSPCNQLSLANPKRKGLFDPSGSGVLFFDFNRVLKFLQATSATSGDHLFFLFENVAAMPHRSRETISKYLQCEPAMWDAIHFLPAQRKRLFWGNIPDLHRDQQCPVNQTPQCLDDILEPHRRAVVSSLPTITTTYHSQLIGRSMMLPVLKDGKEDDLFITERERLFGFPSHFTDGPDLSITARQQLLGRAWSVPVVKAILSPLTKFYKSKSEGLCSKL